MPRFLYQPVVGGELISAPHVYLCVVCEFWYGFYTIDAPPELVNGDYYCDECK